MTRLPWRLAGVVLLLGAMGLWQPDSAGAMARIGVPLVMALATGMIVQNVAAVALGAAILAGVAVAVAYVVGTLMSALI